MLRPGRNPSRASQTSAGTLRLRTGRDAAAVYQLRAQHGFVTPLKPIGEGDGYCVFSTDTMWEWLFHPADAARYLADGITVDGKACVVQRVGEYPMMGAVQLRAFFADRDGSS